ncbi:MAG: Cholesterol oxidase [Chroococcidiopsis cubana SAG 39.79]|uniref:Cholesterol oxidase n=1 Tax=Chroococcidiopsis cubana SAG 39.79 TaxID=388085 RepID=A0AB37U8S9_9CYAN|nr:GMC family oxidoreductase [Chroococcidiopsis cubana]MDZ4877336.1 Cholesterol oxidase [Chroococcidiopsis cubana SAG 39.79]PSB54456.1 GMC family oxidoreductase [Chroococcidiopsis cubana CCALA 043]RUT00690.1 cholesterol oxidase [Chroococcidiopsis cubana SAG 39.79]
MLHQRCNRRHFLQNAALFSTSLVTSLAYARLTRASVQTVKNEAVDALVIGSGFGGAVAALRLGEAGIDTVVLERGRRWLITPEQDTFATFDKPDGRSTWLSQTTYYGTPIDVYTGVLEGLAEEDIIIYCGAGVGGGSLVYNAVTYQPARELFERVFSDSIDYEELDEVYYPRVRSILNPAPIPPDILATPYYDRTRLFLEQATTAGFPNRLYDIAVDWNIVREEIDGTKRPSAIIGNHWFGINSGAKNSLDRNYLAKAESTGFVEILPLHLATTITEVPGHGYQVLCRQINETGETVVEKSFTCRYLFLAAGSMGTSKLLVKAKATGTLPKLNDYVGKYWGTNGDIFSVLSNLPPVSGKGGPAAAVLEHFDNPLGPVVLEDILDPFGADGTTQLLGLAIPQPKGTFGYDAATDSVRLTWPGDPEIVSAIKLTYSIFNQKNPDIDITISDTSNALTAHPLGGAVLGKVCDEYGQVIGYPGLYVVDGALIPGSTACTNPSLTIAALAERCMDRITSDIS